MDASTPDLRHGKTSPAPGTGFVHHLRTTRKGKLVKHIRQPRGSSLCGQACVAMLMGCALSTAQRLVGRDGATKTKHLAAPLRRAGFKLADRLTPWRHGPLPPTAILRIKFRDKRIGHWVLFRRNTIFDPSRRQVLRFKPSLWRRRNGRIGSYVAVSRKGRHR